MAATNGYAGAKLEFRSSVVKKNTEFYKNFVAKKLTDENFKWPECPFKFITKNHLIGTIQSPNRSENVFIDGPQSPSSSHSVSSSPRPSTSNQLMSDMVKLVKGEKSGVKDEAKSEANAPKVEAQAPAIQYTIIQYPFNPMNGPINSIPNAMPLPNILGMPPQVCTVLKIFRFSFFIHSYKCMICHLICQGVGECDTGTQSSRNTNCTYLTILHMLHSHRFCIYFVISCWK